MVRCCWIIWYYLICGTSNGDVLFILASVMLEKHGLGPHRAVYAAAKVGLVSFTKSLAVEEAPYGITVNMICPGDIRGANKEKSIADVIGLQDKETPRGRPGSGEDIARVIAYLCDEHSDFITGNIMDVSGGLDPIRPTI
ncbi:SDR family oxidoreductase [Paenibacillus sp. RC334]|uniref:SDR family oxidoreductase n=1 Tax=Paenibacillus sp. RC334 TaxID=3045840 RepID=UPI0024BBB510|nr:SDR family oxidoreductase [Paenibacillus sp. RC334]